MATDISYLNTDTLALQPWPFGHALVVAMAVSAILWVLIGVAVFVAVT